MYCQISTDRPNDVPSDSSTVPTITAAATTAAGEDQHDDENQAERGDSGDQQVVVGALLHVLVGGRGARQIDLRALQRGALDGLERRVLDLR